jgi:hypothetical protein
VSGRSYNFQDGAVFAIPLEGQFVLAQIGSGGDLAVFEGLVSDIERVPPSPLPMLFRVHFRHSSPSRHGWEPLGIHPYLDDELSAPGVYSHNSVGSSDYYLVRAGAEDEKVRVDVARGFEPLATWGHEHIVERVSTQARQGR